MDINCLLQFSFRLYDQTVLILDREIWKVILSKLLFIYVIFYYTLSIFVEAQSGLREISRTKYFEAIVNGFQQLTIAVKVLVLGVCVSPGYSCVVLCTAVMHLSSSFFNQLLLSRLELVIVSLVSLNFVTTVFLSIFFILIISFLIPYNEKSKLLKNFFVSLITVAVFYCRHVGDKDIVESFYK